MTKEREEYLQKTFPEIYTNCGENNPYTLFGFECDDGWFNLLVRLSQYIQSHIDLNNRLAKKYPDQYKEIPQVKALQVKEKFRTLRFYYCGGDELISAVVSFVEHLSGFTCEATGKTENVGYNVKGWQKTYHESLKIKDDFIFVDDKELRELNLNKE
jgi:hypothetical protein